MPIVSSEVLWDMPQRDGRRAVRERHVDQVGVEYAVDYLAEPGATPSALLAARAAQIESTLAARETDANELRAYDQIAPTLLYSTVAQFRARVRQRFQTATGWDAVRLGKFINGLGLTDAQYQSVFGVSAGAQLTALKTRLANLAARYDAVAADQGQ